MSASPPTYAAAAAMLPAAAASNTARDLPPPPHDQDLTAFWDIFKLGARQKLLNAYFGLECVEDLEDVMLADLKTIAFATWAERHLTIVDKNRLRRAVNHYQLQLRTAHDLYSSPVGVDSVPYALVHPAV
jgi:hypothetical protein